MSRVITFSRVFPSKHPRKGEQTHFVEAILTQIGIDYMSEDYFNWLSESNPDINQLFLRNFFLSLTEGIYPKSHTIRNHKRPLKIGAWINPKCWAGRPYNKTKEGYWQIKFAPDIQVKKRWDFVFVQKDRLLVIGECNYTPLGYDNMIEEASKNDGLSINDFKSWFNKPFKGQIICWNENINY